MITRLILMAVLVCWSWRQALSAETSASRSSLGMNLSGVVDWNTEHPFVDVFRTSRPWISQKRGEAWGRGPRLELDERGWVKRLEQDCYAATPVLTGGHVPSGDEFCFYDGDGEVDFGGSGKLISREPGRIVVRINGRKEATFLSLRKTNPE